MKRKITLIVLTVVLLAVCGGIAIVKGVEKHIESIHTIDEVVYSINVGDVTQVSWNIDGAKLAFVKKEDVWQNSEDDRFPVDADKMLDLLNKFESVHASFIIEDVDDYSQYGLDDPTASITVTSGELEETLQFGTFSTMDSKRYIETEDGNVYLIDDDLLNYISKDRDDYMKHDSIIKPSQVMECKVSGENNIDIIFDDENIYTYTDKYSYYLVENGEYKEISTNNAKSYFDKIKNLSLKDYATYHVSDEDLSKYGLDQPTLTCELTGTVEEDGMETENTSTLYLACIKKGDDETVYARVGNSEIIYCIESKVYDELVNADYASLRPMVVVSPNEEYVNDYEINFENSSYTVKIEKTKDEKSYSMDGQEVEFKGFMDALASMTISETDGSVVPGVLEFSFSIHQSLKGHESVQVDLYRYNGDSCVVKLNDEVLGLVDRASMIDVREAAVKIILNL